MERLTTCQQIIIMTLQLEKGIDLAISMLEGPEQRAVMREGKAAIKQVNQWNERRRN